MDDEKGTSVNPPLIIEISDRISLWIWNYGEVDIHRKGKMSVNLSFDELSIVASAFKRYEEELIDSVATKSVE